MANSNVTTESGGRQNMFPTETRPYIDESVSYDSYPQNAGQSPITIIGKDFPLRKC